MKRCNLCDELICQHAADKLTQLRKENEELKEQLSEPPSDSLKEFLKPVVEALEKLSRLGNEPHLGNSNGNVIAQEAIAHLKEVLK